MATKVGLKKSFSAPIRSYVPNFKFGEDRSTNDVTISSTDAGHRTPDTPNDVIFCPMMLCIRLCIALNRQKA